MVILYIPKIINIKPTLLDSAENFRTTVYNEKSSTHVLVHITCAICKHPAKMN